MPTDAVLFDYDDVLPVIQRAHSEGTRDDAEEATSQAVVLDAETVAFIDVSTSRMLEGLAGLPRCTGSGASAGSPPS